MGHKFLQLPGPMTMLSTHPSVNVVVGSGGAVGCPYEQLDNTAGQAQISVVCGPTSVVTVAVGEHQSPPGSVVCLASRSALAWTHRPVTTGPEAPVVHVGQLPQPGLLSTETVSVHAPEDTLSVEVTGGRGVGPVGSPAEQLDVGTRHAGHTPNRMGVVVMVVVGVRHPLLTSPGRVLASRRARVCSSPGRVPK